MEVFQLSCPSCGSNLEITSDIDRFACGYCGKQLLVNRSGGIVSVKPLVEKLTNIEVSTDHTASELTINRLKEEIADLEESINEEKSTKKIYRLLSILGAGVFILGMLIVLMNFGKNTQTNLYCGILPAILTSILFFINVLAKIRLNKKITSVRALIADKETQLERHLEIVNNQFR